MTKSRPWHRRPCRCCEQRAPAPIQYEGQGSPTGRTTRLQELAIHANVFPSPTNRRPSSIRMSSRSSGTGRAKVPSRANRKRWSKYRASRPERAGCPATRRFALDFERVSRVGPGAEGTRNPMHANFRGQKHGYLVPFANAVTSRPSSPSSPPGRYRARLRGAPFSRRRDPTTTTKRRGTDDSPTPPSARSVVWCGVKGRRSAPAGPAHGDPPATDCRSRGPPERAVVIAERRARPGRQRPGECSQLPFDGSRRPGSADPAGCASTGSVEPRENSSMATRARASRERTVPTGIPRRPAIPA